MGFFEGFFILFDPFILGVFAFLCVCAIIGAMIS